MVLGAMALPACDPCDVPCDEGEVCLIVGTGEAGWNGDEHCGPETKLYLPSSVGRDPQGRIAIMDFNNWRLRVLDGDVVRTIAGSGEHRGAEVGVLPAESPFENPIAMDWAPDGTLYIAELHVGAVVRAPLGGPLEAYLGDGQPSDDGDGGPAVAAHIYAPCGVAVGGDTVYVSDVGSHRVRAVGPDGVVHTVLGDGAPGDGSSQLAFPERVAWDSVGERLLVADAGNHRVLAWRADTGAVVLAGGRGAGRDGDGGLATQASLDTPRGVAAGPDGTVWVADTGNRVVRRIDPDGVIETVLGSDVLGEEASRHGDPLEFPVSGPVGLFWDEDGSLLVTDMTGHRVLRLTIP